jgi:methylglyoxal synthase
MDKTKNIALVAHDNRKIDLMEWVTWNCRTLLQHRLVCTGTTGKVKDRRHDLLLGSHAAPPHDVDVKALLRIAVVYNIPIACNRSTADFLISSPLMNERYNPALKDYEEYINRRDFLTG